MSESERLLELIEKGVVEHGGDLGGWTRFNAGELKLFDGRVTLRAELEDPGSASTEKAVHAHVLTTLHDYDDEVLDACVFGMAEDRDGALTNAAFLWITIVAGPIKSFLDDKPICMSCQAGAVKGDPKDGYSRGDYGLPGLRAYVGPSFSRGLTDNSIGATVNDTKPWFRYAAESAAPRRVHMAKASIFPKGEQGWTRELEIDGHEVSHHDPDWPAGVSSTGPGYMVRFAVFEFPPDSPEIHWRAELDKTIRYFAENYSKHESVDQLMEAMAHSGFNPDLIHETEAISTIAFSRALFEQHGVQFSSTIIRARKDGRVETGVPLMSIPAYSRARALAAELHETMNADDFQALCLYNAEANAILKAMEGSDKLDLAKMKLYPCVVPDRGVDDHTMDMALAKLDQLINRNRTPPPQTKDTAPKKKRWWNF